MRVLVREHICEVLATLYEGIEYASSARDIDALPVLEDCAAAVNAVRESLKGQLSESRAEFYDKYAAAAADGIVKVTGGIKAEADISEAAEETLEQLRIIYTHLLEESEVKLEVAFFPYKASMWDSLESVWMAAKEDERCNTTVVPIRYYEKNIDDTALKEVCERDMFPDYVPVANYENYSPKLMAPDIAYIHNPYDGNNYVTSVDPDYYSHALKKHVGLLVYVPYYVSGYMSAAGMAMSACASAADVIAAFSEDEATNLRSYDHSKDIQALGSPKVDRILRYEREKPEMPPEWRERLEGKKVFLLNTSVSSLLRYDESFCEKMNRIFDIFENRDDAALLWRPHPLSSATINSMRPELRAGYNELTRRVRGFGVLDETADVTRAIALSDAYIGESATSLLFMYGLTGKPEYLLDFNIVKGIDDSQREEILRAAGIMAVIPEPGGGTALAINYETNEICRIELDTGRVIPLADIPETGSDYTYEYVKIVDCGDKYILPPYCGDKFIELDRDFKLLGTVELPERAKAGIVFGQSVRYGDYVYFLPYRSQAFARYQISTGEYEYFYEWYKDFAQYALSYEPSVLSPGSYCIVGGKMYLPCHKDNIVAELNLESMKLRTLRVGSRDNRYFTIANDGKYFWLTLLRPRHIDASQWNEKIVRWEIKTGRTEEFSGFPNGVTPEGTSNLRIIALEKMLLAFSFYENKIIRIEPKTGEMSEFVNGLIKREEEILPELKNIVFSYVGHLGEDAVYSVMARERALLIADKKTGETKKIKLRFDSPHKVERRADPRWFMSERYSCDQKRLFVERLLFEPEEFVNEVVSGEIAKDAEQAEFFLKLVSSRDGTAGEKIHEYVINKIMGNEEA